MDPLKEAQAAEVGLKNGIVTFSDIYAQEGKDWEESFEQRKREETKIKELGLEQAFNGNQTNQNKTIADPNQDDQQAGAGK